MDLKTGRLLKVFGLLVSLVCCVFVAQAIFSRRELLENSPGWDLLPAVAFGTLLWVLVNVCLGLGWRHLAALFGNQLSVAHSVGLSLRTQIGKYVPGNVFHHVGRTVLAKRYGVRLAAAGSATVAEALYLVLIALGFGLSYLVRQGLLAIALGIFAAAAAVLLFICKNPARFENLWGPAKPGNHYFQGFWRAGVFYAAVLVLQALMFILFSQVIPLGKSFSFLQVLEMVSITWAAGFVVVGAPGGLGVREAVYATFAGTPELQWQLLYIASWMRVSSILGDTFSFFISGFFLRRPPTIRKHE